MADATLIEDAYERIGLIEQQKRRLTLIVLGCLLPALLGLGANAFYFVAFSHQKGGLTGSNIIIIGILALVCIGLMGIAVKKSIALRKLGDKLNQIELLEETIYNEVLKHHAD